MRPTDQRVLSLMMDERAYDYRQISSISGRPIGSLGPTRERIIRRLRTNPQVAELMARLNPRSRMTDTRFDLLTTQSAADPLVASPQWM